MVRIGVFDSGIGGLSVLRDLRQLLPTAEYTYYADTTNVPYGGRSVKEIERLSLAALEITRQHQPDAIVVACNTATSVAIQKLRSVHSDIPIVGVVPVIKKAAEASKTKKIAVLATEATLKSHSYESLKRTFAEGVEVLDLALPEWVTLTEQGKLDDTEARASVQAVAEKIRTFGADVVALGCTHFVFLRPILETEMPGVTILDSGEAVARQTKHVLESNLKLPDADGQGSVQYFSSGDVSAFSAAASKLLGETIVAKQV